MAIAAALPGFNDLARLVIASFLCRNRFFTIISTFSENEQNINVGNLKKIIGGD